MGIDLQNSTFIWENWQNKEKTKAISCHTYINICFMKNQLQCVLIKQVNLWTLQTHSRCCNFNCKIHFSIDIAIKIKPDTKLSYW